MLYFNEILESFIHYIHKEIKNKKVLKKTSLSFFTMANNTGDQSAYSWGKKPQYLEMN